MKLAPKCPFALSESFLHLTYRKPIILATSQCAQSPIVPNRLTIVVRQLRGEWSFLLVSRHSFPHPIIGDTGLTHLGFKSRMDGQRPSSLYTRRPEFFVFNCEKFLLKFDFPQTWHHLRSN